MANDPKKPTPFPTVRQICTPKSDVLVSKSTHLVMYSRQETQGRRQEKGTILAALEFPSALCPLTLTEDDTRGKFRFTASKLSAHPFHTNTERSSE